MLYITFNIGKVLWQGDNSALNSGWNNYNPTVLPDLDGDGVKDVLLPHGGDPTVPNYVSHITCIHRSIYL